MDSIDAALLSLKDSLDQLAQRFRGSEGEAAQLFRARLMLDATRGKLAAARANGAVPSGWGGEFVDGLNLAAMPVAAAPSSGGEVFPQAIAATTDALAAINSALPH